MGTPIAFMSGTTNGFSVGATKRATIGLNTGTSLVSGNNWWNGVDVGSQYLLYSDQFSQGQSVIPTSRPTAWSTPSITDQNLLNLINTLPDRVGLTPFVNINVALQWLQNSQKYLLLKNGYENIVTDGLVLNLDAGWANSYPGTGTVWTDLSGNGNNGNLVNGPTLSSNGLGSISFDGTNDYVTDSSYTPPNNTQLTIDIWTKPNSTTQKTTLISKWGASAQAHFSWLLFLNWFSDGYIYFLVGDGSGTSYSQIGGLHGLSTSEYTNFTVTYNAGNVVIYRNGVSIGSGSSTSTLKSVSTPLTIGADWDGSSTDTITRPYNGEIAVTRIYSKALSPTEIQQNYDAQKSRFGLWGQTLWSGYTQYYDFSKGQSYIGSGAAMNDLSGIGYNGSVLGGSFATVDGVKCWNCSTNGRIVTDTDFTFGNDYTILIWARALSDSQVSTWRTLLRTTPNDHPLIIADGSDLIGYYDNDDGGNFVSYGITLASANLDNVWGLYSLVGTNGNSQKLYLNDGTTNATVNYSATGEKQDAWGSTDDGTQPFGYVSSMVVYNNQAFTQAQVAQYFNATKQYYGYAPNNTISYGLVMSLDAGQAISYPGTGTAWNDLSPYGNNVTLVNGPTFSSTNGGSIVFDGSNDYGLAGKINQLNIGGDLTLEAWIKQTSTYSVNPAIICNGFYSELYPYKFQFEYMGGNSNLGLFRYDGTNYRYARWNFGSQSTYFLNQIVYVAVTTSGSNWNIYYNGINQSLEYFNSSPSSVSVNNTTNCVIAGQLNSAGNDLVDLFPGNVYVARIYNRALSAAEIKQNFNAQKARFGL